MAADDDPPRKLYELKPREFERVNQDESALPVSAVAPASQAAPFDPAAPITLEQIIAAANARGPVQAGAQPPPKNEVQALLAANLAREASAGLTRVDPRSDRRNRRPRDYLLLMLATNVPLMLLGIAGLRTGNAMLAASSFGGVGLCSAGITWIMWAIVDKY
jgi:hypothetical protein